MVVPTIETPAAGPGGGSPGDRRLVLVLAVVALVVVLVVAFAWHSARRDDRPAVPAPHQVSAGKVSTSKGNVTAAQLDLVGGTDSLTVTTGDLGDDLVVAATAPDSRSVPVIQGSDGHGSEPGRVLVTTQGDPVQPHGSGPVNLAVRLARGVRWTILVDGGTQLLRLDLSGTDLRSLDITQGVATIDATLPRPDGLLVTRIAGGASAVRLHLPPNVPAGLTFSGGGGSATVDSQHRQGLSGGTTMTTEGWTPSATPRFEVDLDSGIGSLVADRYGS